MHSLRLYLCINDLLSVYAMNGKSVEIDNTDAEGRLVLAGNLHLGFIYAPVEYS
jgi:hypothetical protein